MTDLGPKKRWFGFACRPGNAGAGVTDRSHDADDDYQGHGEQGWMGVFAWFALGVSSLLPLL